MRMIQMDIYIINKLLYLWNMYGFGIFIQSKYSDGYLDDPCKKYYLTPIVFIVLINGDTVYAFGFVSLLFIGHK